MLKQVLALSLAAIIAALLINTARFGSVQLSVEPVAPIALDETASVTRLADILRFKTISYGKPADFDPQPFVELRHFLQKSYPLVHAQMSLEVFGGHSLLYRLEGSNSELKPLLLMAHMDVVPVEQTTIDQWQQPPFGGVVEQDTVWGRGTLDDKSSLVAILEAMEYLLANGLQPSRDIYLAFGHDEEHGGGKGAALIARELEHRGIQFEFVLDEGGAITNGISSSLSQPTALIAVAEKGGVTLQLTMNGEGGHSSKPPPVSTIGALSRAIVALEEQQMPATLNSPTGTMFDVLAREMSFLPRLLFANRWLTEPLLLMIVDQNPALNSMMRTTTAPTLFSAGLKSNVLPASASAVVNFRLLPGDSVEAVIRHVERVIDNADIEVTLAGLTHREASRVSDHNSRAYRQIEKSIRQVMPDTLVAPNLMIGGSDAKHFRGISDNTYHFIPYTINKGNITAVHGINERLPVADYLNMIRFYAQLLLNTAQ